LNYFWFKFEGLSTISVGSTMGISSIESILSSDYLIADAAAAEFIVISCDVLTTEV